MAIGAIPKLTHMVIYVKDLAKMERFYTEVMGFIVSDRGAFPDPDAPENIVFLTGTKEEHHEMVLFQNDETDMESQGQQISYLVKDLDQLRDLYHRVQAEGNNYHRGSTAALREKFNLSMSLIYVPSGVTTPLISRRAKARSY